MWTDSHCHLPLLKPEPGSTHYNNPNPPLLSDYLARANEQGIHRFLNICTDTPDLENLEVTSHALPNVYHTAGIHPHDGKLYTQEKLTVLDEALSHPKCLAVGECGIDTHYQNSNLEQQLIALDVQLELALKHHKPLMIHSRESEDVLYERLNRFASAWGTDSPPGILHCFSGSSKFGRQCLELGFLVSFSGILTFKTAQTLRDFAQTLDPTQVLVETDSPFLAPVPYRGKPCESWMMIETAKVLAQSLRISLESLAEATEKNFNRAFSVDS